MKVLVFASFPPNKGGAEKGNFHILKGLTENYNNLFIDLVTYNPYSDKIKNLNVYHFNLGTITNFMRGFKYILFATLKGIKLNLKNNYDLIYAKSIFSPGVPASINAFLFNKKLIVHTSGTDIKSSSASDDYRFGFLYLILTNFFRKLVINKSTLVISNAKFDKKQILNKFPKTKVVNVYNGIDFVHYKPSHNNRVKLRRSLNFKNSDFITIYVGTTKKRKNLNVILQAANSLKNIKFLFVGPTKEQLKKFGKISSNCKTIGLVKDTSLYLQASDLFVLPSKWEGTSNALLEALSVGLPVVVYPAGESSLLIKNGINGYVVDNPKDFINKIEYLSKNKKLIKKIGYNNRKLILNEFSWDKCIKKMNYTFKEVLRK